MPPQQLPIGNLASPGERLPTPFVLVDRAVVQQNLDRLGSYALAHRLNVRPHAKTHKSREIGRWQLECGAIGLTVAKPSEAEVFVSDCSDLLLAYPVVDADRAQRIAYLAARADLKVAVDSAQSAEVLSAAAVAVGANIGILVDLDVGLHRTGVQDGQRALKLAQHVNDSQGLRLRGLFCYPGHIWSPANSQASALRDVGSRLQQALDLWESSGLNAEIVSGGSTPTAFQSHLVEQLTEIRPGTYVFNDMNTVVGGYARIEDCAARIIVTVVSDAVANQIVVDAGTKTIAADRCIPQSESGYGYVVELPDAQITKLSEEHGQIDVSRCSTRPRVGERLSIIPNHICPCINLQDRIWTASETTGLEPLAIDARGKTS